MDFFEVLGVGMLLERDNPNPRRGVHLIWAGEKVRPENLLASPALNQIERLESGKPVVSLVDLVQMKLMANRDQDRVLKDNENSCFPVILLPESRARVYSVGHWSLPGGRLSNPDEEGK